jgi:hypothetical protein
MSMLGTPCLVDTGTDTLVDSDPWTASFISVQLLEVL